MRSAFELPLHCHAMLQRARDGTDCREGLQVRRRARDLKQPSVGAVSPRAATAGKISERMMPGALNAAGMRLPAAPDAAEGYSSSPQSFFFPRLRQLQPPLLFFMPIPSMNGPSHRLQGAARCCGDAGGVGTRGCWRETAFCHGTVSVATGGEQCRGCSARLAVS